MSRECLQQAIKLVNIGKRGSKDLSLDLIEQCRTQLTDASLTEPLLTGNLIGGLWIKSRTAAEEALLRDIIGGSIELSQLLNQFDIRCSSATRDRFEILLKGRCLNLQEAQALGGELFNEGFSEILKGIAVAVLRIRYETEDEYYGLYLSLQPHINSIKMQTNGQPCIVVAEPFDGVMRTHMITPVIAETLTQAGYNVMLSGGHNGGPKSGHNLADLAKALSIPHVYGDADSMDSAKVCFVHQRLLCPALHQWVARRRLLIKRPSLATLERFVTPIIPDIFIASAFHAPYGEKMIRLAERIGFPATIIIRNGMEGTVAFPLKRAARMLVSARDEAGQYHQKEMLIDPFSILDAVPAVEEKLTVPSLAENVSLVKQFVAKQQTKNRHFDQRVMLSCYGLKQALTWIHQIRKSIDH